MKRTDESESMIEKALEVALDAHKAQKRLDNKPYILHPIRIMTRASDENEKILCLLHDVIEDSEVKISQIAALGFSENILDALEAITHREDELYKDYIKRVEKNPLAKKVKLLDLEDNLDPDEWPDTDKYLKKIKRYYAARKKLLGKNGSRQWK